VKEGKTDSTKQGRKEGRTVVKEGKKDSTNNGRKEGRKVGRELRKEERKGHTDFERGR
jgi:hypothetical protein